MDKTNTLPAEVLSVVNLIVEKATLEARIRQIAPYVSSRKSYVEALGEHFQSRLDDITKLKRLCNDYLLYSPNLDGSVQEILLEVKKGAEDDDDFFVQMLELEEAGLKSIVVECVEMIERLMVLRKGNQK